MHDNNNSDENIPSLDSATAEFITKLFQDITQSVYMTMSDKMASMEKSLESLEKQVADLIFGYGEQAVFMEALIAQMAFATDEARTAFHENISKSRKLRIEVMQSAAKGILDDEKPGTAAAVANLAESKLSDSDS